MRYINIKLLKIESMKRELKTQLFIALTYVLVLGMWGCTNQFENFETQTSTELEQSVGTISLNDIVFHDASRSWLKPQADPYTLENFQRAYARLSSGNSNQIVTGSLSEEFKETRQLTATHYALRIYPRNEKEQSEIESMDDITVAYLPFDHVLLPKNAVKDTETLIKKGTSIYPEERRYTVTYDDYETIDGPIEPQTYIMPVLYVVWPIDKPLADDLDYEVDYEVFLPQRAIQTRSTTLNANAIKVLEKEAIQLAFGSASQSGSTARAASQRSGRIYTYDIFAQNNGLGSALPMSNLNLMFKVGSNNWNVFTRFDGSFDTPSDVPDEAVLMYALQHDRWKIIYDNITIFNLPYFGWICDNIGNEWGTGDFYLTSVDNEMACHRAIEYYYYDVHEIPTRILGDGGIKVRVSALSNSEANGTFTYSNTNPPYITIYNNNVYSPNLVIGTLSHELGHFAHYSVRGGFNNFKNVHNLIKESYASYAGWYLCERYYFRHGYVRPFPSTDPTGNGRQFWTMSSTSPYSPLFVDLIDVYDQSTAGSMYVLDRVSNVPHSVIERVAREATNWTSCRSILQSYIGTYYTEVDINNIISAYNFWFANN